MRNEARSILLVQMGHETYGIPIEMVRELTPCPHVTQVPVPFPHQRGMAALRGEFIPILDLCSLCGYPGENPSLLVVAEQGGKALGYLVSGVESIVSVAVEDIELACAELAGGSIKEIAKLGEGRLVGVLDFEQLIGNRL